jgi:hypothetical protein
VAEALEGNGAELAAAVYDSGGKMRSVKVDSLALSALRADISVRAAEKLATLENFCVTTDISDIVDDEAELRNAVYCPECKQLKLHYASCNNRNCPCCQACPRQDDGFG